MKFSTKRLVLAIGIILVIATVCVIYKYFNPEEYALWPKCIFHLLTGLECPGCGSQRAIHSLSNGEVSKALHYNLLIVLAIPYLFLFGLIQLFSAMSQKGKLKQFCHRIDLLLYRGKAIKIITVLIIAFWIARNLSLVGILPSFV